MVDTFRIDRDCEVFEEYEYYVCTVNKQADKGHGWQVMQSCGTWITSEEFTPFTSGRVYRKIKVVPYVLELRCGDSLSIGYVTPDGVSESIGYIGNDGSCHFLCRDHYIENYNKWRQNKGSSGLVPVLWRGTHYNLSTSGILYARVSGKLTGVYDFLMIKAIEGCEDANIQRWKYNNSPILFG